MINKEKNFASAVIYIHNAGTVIEEFLNAVRKTMEDNFEHSEIICVNDYSQDDSIKKIKKVSMNATTTSISVINMSYFHGLELAMKAGVDLSIGDFVFEFDQTILDFNEDEIIKVYRKSLEGYDIVSASPNVKQKFTSNLFYKVFNHFASLDYEMRTERFRVMSRRIINRINDMNKSVPYRKALYATCGLKTENIVYDTTENGKKKSNDSEEKKYRGELAGDSLVLFTNLGYSFSKGMSILMILITATVLVYTIIAYAISNPVEGWTSTVLFLSVAFFGLFAILTIIIKYLKILVDLVFKRKHYSYESIEKLTK